MTMFLSGSASSTGSLGDGRFSGNVGIFTSGSKGPNTPLHIRGDFDGSGGLPNTDPNKGLNISKFTGVQSDYGKGDKFGITFTAASNAVSDFALAGIYGQVTNVSSYVGGSIIFATRLETENALTAKMAISSSGNVGIGRTDPQFKLDVYNNGSATEVAIGKYAAGKTVGVMGTSGDTGGYFHIQSYLNQGTSFGNIALNQSGGNVGIGNSSPGAKLDVTGEIRGQKFAFNDDTNTHIDTLAADQIGFTLGGNTSVRWAFIAGAVTQQYMYGSSATYPSYTFFSDQDTGMFNATTNALGFSTGGSEKMRIDSSGNIGIGLSSPQFKVHISGSTDLLWLQGSGAPQLRMTDNSATSDGDTFALIDFAGMDHAGSALVLNRISNVIVDNTQGTTDSRLGIHNRVNGTLTEVLSVASGKVGIGTTSPSANLSISGSGDSTKNELSIESDVYPILRFKSYGNNANNREFRFASVYNTYGKFEILSATNNTGAATTTRLSISGTTGDIEFPTANAKLSGSATSTGSFGSVESAGNSRIKGLLNVEGSNGFAIGSLSDAVRIDSAGDSNNTFRFLAANGQLTGIKAKQALFSDNVVVNGNVSGSATSTGSFGMLGIGVASPNAATQIVNTVPSRAALNVTMNTTGTAAMNITNTSNANQGLYVYSNHSSATSPLSYVRGDHTSGYASVALLAVENDNTSGMAISSKGKVLHETGDLEVRAGNISGSATSTGSFGSAHIAHKVGIGTTGPGTVLPTGWSGNRLLEIRASSSGGDAGLFLRRFEGDGTYGMDFWTDTNSADNYIDSRGGISASELFIRVATHTSPINAARFDYLGNVEFPSATSISGSATSTGSFGRVQAADKLTVGSGTATADLHVFGTEIRMAGDTPALVLQDTSAFSAGTGPSLFFQGLQTGESLQTFAAIQGQSVGSGTGALAFQTRQSGTTGTKMYLDEDGKLGVGTTNPGAQFHVVGNSFFEGSKVSGSQYSTGSFGMIALPKVNKLGEYFRAGETIGRYLSISAVSTTNVGDTHVFNAVSATGHLKFQTTSNDRMIINSTGVGIGITPTTKLDVDGAVTIRNYAAFYDDNGTTLAGYVGSGNDLAFGDANDLCIRGVDSIKFTANNGNSDAMTINSSGNVGIGTTNPSTALHLRSTADAEPYITIEQAGTNVNSGGITMANFDTQDNDILGTIRFKGKNDTPIVAEYATIYSRAIDVSAGSIDGELHFRTVANNTLATRMIIQSGNVGIGTTSPSVALEVRDATANNGHIGGKINVAGDWNESNIAYGGNRSPGVTIQSLDSTAGTFGTLSFMNASGYTGATVIAKHVLHGAGTGNMDTQLHFGTRGIHNQNSGAHDVSAMMIDEDGRVGIGKTSLSKTLHVDSNIGSAGTPNGIMLTNHVAGSNSKIYMYADNDSGAAKNASITLDPDAETMAIDYNGNALTIDSSGNVEPGADNSYNLGAADKRWANIFSADLQLSNEGTEGNEVDGTTGSWTIQEGEDDLYLLNRKNGKKYKFKLEEIT